MSRSLVRDTRISKKRNPKWNVGDVFKCRKCGKRKTIDRQMVSNPRCTKCKISMQYI
jgi:transcription initiation factor IIE alpha subunit